MFFGRLPRRFPRRLLRTSSADWVFLEDILHEAVFRGRLPRRPKMFLDNDLFRGRLPRTSSADWVFLRDILREDVFRGRLPRLSSAAVFRGCLPGHNSNQVS